MERTSQNEGDPKPSEEDISITRRLRSRKRSRSNGPSGSPISSTVAQRKSRDPSVINEGIDEMDEAALNQAIKEIIDQALEKIDFSSCCGMNDGA